MRIVRSSPRISSVFFCTDTPTPEIYTLSLHDALPIYQDVRGDLLQHTAVGVDEADVAAAGDAEVGVARLPRAVQDRKSTRLNSSHRCISYAVFCLKKKKDWL